MEFENSFSRPGQGHGNIMKFHCFPKYFMYNLKNKTFSLSLSKNMCPQKTFLSHENLNWS